MTFKDDVQGGGEVEGLRQGQGNDVLAERPLGGVGKRWEEERRVAGAGLVPEHFALHSGRIGGATRLAAMGLAEAVIQREGR